MADVRRLCLVAGTAALAALLGSCGAPTHAVVEAADGAPEPAVRASPSPAALAAPAVGCTVPPLPSVTPASILGLGPDGPTFEQIRDQEDVVNALARAHQIAETEEGLAVIRHMGGRAAEIAWKGDPPDSIAALAGTSATCVTIRVVSVPFSRAEINAAGTRVFDAAKLGRVPAPTTTGANELYAGLEIGYAELPTGAEAEELYRSLVAVARMPVTLVQHNMVSLLTATSPPAA